MAGGEALQSLLGATKCYTPCFISNLSGEVVYTNWVYDIHLFFGCACIFCVTDIMTKMIFYSFQHLLKDTSPIFLER